MVGIDARLAAAIKLPQSVEYCCMNIWIPTGMVIVLGSRRKILAIRNSLWRALENVFQSITEKNRFVKGFDDENFIDVARHLEGCHHMDHILPGCGIQ